jgi:hypothetical protein
MGGAAPAFQKESRTPVPRGSDSTTDPLLLRTRMKEHINGTMESFSRIALPEMQYVATYYLEQAFGLMVERSVLESAST